MKNKPLVSLLAFSTLFFAMLLPPEAYPNGKMAVVICATFVFLIALSERKVAQSFVNAGIAIFGLLLLHSLLISVDLYRSLDLLQSLWAYYCLIGFFVYSSEGSEKQLAAAVVLLSLIVSGYGIYQYFWGFDKIYSYIFYSASDQVAKVPALDVVAKRRVFSTLALPGTLWGFLVCALPFHAMLWKKSRWLDVVLVVSVLMLLATGFLTRSFGFLLGLFVLVVSALWLRYRRLMWNRVTFIVLLLAIVGGLFYSARRGAIEDANPAGLRFKNWVSAWNIFAEHPMGTGLNTFGVVYPEFMQPDANETQYVHNTPLQLLSELGDLLVLALIVIIVARARGPQGFRWTERPEAFWLLLALAVWVTHNLVDIDVYFPSVGVLGAVLIGSLFAQPQTERASLSRLSIACVGVFAAVAVVFSGMVCISSELQNRAQIEFENKKLLLAVETLSEARKICPINSSLYHDSGEILLQLFQLTRKPEYLADATNAFQTEVRLSPEKSGAHVGYGLSLSTANKLPEALEQIRIAQRLYPRSVYVQSIAQLMEQRLQ